MAKQENWQEREEREREESKAGLRKACAVLERLGVRSVEIPYDGSGDEGFLREMSYDPDPPAGIPEGLKDLIENFVYRYLPGGWEINDGSYGTVTLDIPSLKARRDHNWRIVETHEEEEETDI